MFFGGDLPSMLIGALAILLSITVHELSHGYVAYLLGDETAKNAGRLTLNPIKHLDPLGALLMFLFGFGWAKPVPINPFFFKGNRTTGVMLVSIAGPLANILLAIVIAIVLPLLLPLHPIFTVLPNVIYLNIYLAIFNLLPIPPLDGSKIVAGFLPKQTGIKFLMTMERYGFFILLVLALIGILSAVITPIADFIYYNVIWHFVMIFA